jgi:hypothetical protein
MPATFPWTPRRVTDLPFQTTSSPVAARPATSPFSFTASAQLLPSGESVAVPRSCIWPSRHKKAWTPPGFTSEHPTTTPESLTADP